MQQGLIIISGTNPSFVKGISYYGNVNPHTPFYPCLELPQNTGIPFLLTYNIPFDKLSKIGN